jgi:hypothetical protein
MRVEELMALKLTKVLGFGALLLVVGAFGCSEGSDDGGEDADETGGTASGGSGTTGGDASAGGAEETGGAAGADAETGGTGPSPTEEMLYDFAEDRMGFELQDYLPDDPQYVNLYAAGSDTQDQVSLSWVSDPGQDGEPGMLQLEIPFSDDNQSVDIQLNLPDMVDWSGRILHAWIYVESGLVDDESYCGGAMITVKTGEEWVYGSSTWKNLCSTDFGTWVEVTFELDYPSYANAGFDPAFSRTIGLQVASGGPAETKPAATPAVVYIDSISIE